MFTALSDRVFIKRIGDDSYDAAGLIIKHDKTVGMETFHKGVIVSAGIRCVFVRNSEVVLYKAITSKDVEVEGEKLIMIREGEVWGVIVGDEKQVQLA